MIGLLLLSALLSGGPVAVQFVRETGHPWEWT